MKLFGKLSLSAFLAIIAYLVNCSWAVARNAQNFKSFVPFEKIEAETYTSMSYAYVYSDCADANEYRVGSIDSETVLMYAGVDFEEGAEAVTFRISGARQDYATGSILLRLDSASSQPFDSITAGCTGSKCTWTVINSFLPNVISGVHDLYLTFVFDPPTTDINFVDIDWFYFNRTVTIS